ncbi:protein kinase, partial [Streptomyces sp. NPDC058964]
PAPRTATRRPEDAAAALAALQYGTAAARAPRSGSADHTESEPAHSHRADDTGQTEHEEGATR